MLKIICTSSDKPRQFVLVVGKKYRVGRKDCSIDFPDDQSISRHHAEIVVEHPMANMTDPLLTPTVVVTDVGSKFGTFVNDGIEKKSKMAMREGLNLSPGDRFKFGLQWNEYRIEYTPLIVSVSGCKGDELHKLKTTIMTLGGHLVPDWTKECNLLVMDELDLTVKAVCALLAAKHIVTPVYFQDFLMALKNNKRPPNPIDFLPPKGDTELNVDGTFDPITGRSTLFANKVFVFVGVKQFKKMSAAVEAGGGTAKLFADVTIKDLLKEDYILMKPSETQGFLSDSKVKSTIATYEKTKRLIHDSELGLAALYLNANWHCNPYHEFNDNETLPKLPETQHLDKNPVIVPPTQDMETQLSDTSPNTRKIVEETILEDKAPEKNPKVKTERTTGGEPPSKKRPAEESLPRNAREKRRRQAAAPRGLSSIFGFSDDEDDDEEIVIPDSPPPPEADSIMESGAGQVQGTQEPNTLNTSDIAQQRPSSPDMFESHPPVVEPVFKSPERRATRSSARTSPQVAVIEPTSSASSRSTGRNKRKIDVTPETSPVKIEPQPVNKKQKSSKKQSKAADDSENLVEKTQKLAIKSDIKDEKNDGDELPKAVEVLQRLLKGPKIQPTVQVVNGKNILNFKPFKKVLPLAMQQNNVSFASGSSRSSRLAGGTNISNRSFKVTFEVFEYSPGPGGNKQDSDKEDRNNDDDRNERRPATRIKRRVTRDTEPAEVVEPMELSSPPSSPGPRASRRTTRATKQRQTSPIKVEEPPQKTSGSGRASRSQTKKKVETLVLISDDEDEAGDDLFQF